MKDDVDAVYDLAKSAALARFRILGVEGEEHSDRSWQRVTCHIHREEEKYIRLAAQSETSGTRTE
jgi:hypothetical protein